MCAGALRSLHSKLRELEREAGEESLRAGEAGEILFIWCADIGFPDTVVETSDAEVADILNRFKSDREHARRVFNRALSHFTRIKEAGNFEEIYMENGQPWKDFANDACLHFVARAFLHGKTIPLVRKETLQESPMQGRDPI
jgi:hypothetical protein